VTEDSGGELGRDPDDRSSAAREAERRRRARVFGDVLPEQTGDDQSSDPSGDRSPDGSADEWLRSQVPPHHG
jgi:hypothetical protein